MREEPAPDDLPALRLVCPRDAGHDALRRKQRHQAVRGLRWRLPGVPRPLEAAAAGREGHPRIPRLHDRAREINAGTLNHLPRIPGREKLWRRSQTSGCGAPQYCDESKSIDERVDFIVSNMTLTEKIRAISPQPDLGNTCGTNSTYCRSHLAQELLAVEDPHLRYMYCTVECSCSCSCSRLRFSKRLTRSCLQSAACGKPSIGLPNYAWLVEANSAIAASCYTANKSDPYRWSGFFD